jgi:hypothetical protein
MPTGKGFALAHPTMAIDAARIYERISVPVKLVMRGFCAN